MEDFELELKQDFLNESADLLEAAENAFLTLEEKREDSNLINEIFRLAHNLKGTSKAVGFDQLAELTHIAENLILKLKDGEMEVSDTVVTALLEFKDKINEMIEGLKEDIDASFDTSNLQQKLQDLCDGNAEEEEAMPEEEESFSEVKSVENIPSAEEFEEIEEEMPEVVASTPQISAAALESLKETGVSTEVLNDLEKESKPVAAPVSNPQEVPRPSAKKKTSAKVDESIRVKLDRIDKINNVIGELVILQTIINQRRYEFIQDELSNKSIGMMGKLFKEVQEIAMSLRMVPLKTTFQKMNRIIRDTSKHLDKEVRLHLLGEDTEVDKTVLEKLVDPLVHIVRNAVDHGLETASERQDADKAPIGNVELYAFHEGSNLVIQVTDDGKGINPEVIRKKAIEKGILNQNSNISDQEVLQLIFHPGFSTKEKVTEVSGRGVGMDVVKTNIESLGGEVKLMSKMGEGSSFKIILPLTLAIIEGLVITAHDEKFVLPLSQVYEITQVHTKDVETFSGVANLFKLRGEVLPLFFVNDKLGLKNQESTSHTVVIVRGLNHAFGVVVEDILNQQQIVIKKLGEDIQNRKGIIGSAIMSDGMPSLILDLVELFKGDIKQSQAYKRNINRQRVA
jgi:two-component system chemotaxis sensor kinase CheA